MPHLSIVFALVAVSSLFAAKLKVIPRPGLMRSCKIECPDAKDEKQMSICAEKLSLSAGAKKFERTKCFKEFKRLQEKKD
jgi:hypothetical protein